MRVDLYCAGTCVGAIQQQIAYYEEMCRVVVASRCYCLGVVLAISGGTTQITIILIEN